MVFYLGREKKKTGHAGWWARGAVLGADLAALGRVGAEFALLSVGWAWDLAVLWARWARLGVGFGSGGRARRWAGLGWDLAFHVRSTLYTPSSCLYVVVFILMMYLRCPSWGWSIANKAKKQGCCECFLI